MYCTVLAEAPQSSFPRYRPCTWAGVMSLSFMFPNLGTRCLLEISSYLSKVRSLTESLTESLSQLAKYSPVENAENSATHYHQLNFSFHKTSSSSRRANSCGASTPRSKAP